MLIYLSPIIDVLLSISSGELFGIRICVGIDRLRALLAILLCLKRLAPFSYTN